MKRSSDRSETIPFKKRKLAYRTALNERATVYEWGCNGLDAIKEMDRLRSRILTMLTLSCKWFIMLNIEMVKDSIYHTCAFRNTAKIILREDERAKQYEEVKAHILKNIEAFNSKGK